ncbi:hypothetical protein TUM4636_18180 [Shewanella glacialipiscicola]|uniref:Uncharacterized protein n=1 Tax=Shewanella glacialipiscicola TaxID=614069 RepID=A0ABQ6J424_9GAMM|nr:hypothetical protein TUM4636_18180 [Shewanella glacialipiscicola]GMA82886.1 hypothetical protein GCM10025855_24190 [Shewanella glacialipiscicola]
MYDLYLIVIFNVLIFYDGLFYDGPFIGDRPRVFTPKLDLFYNQTSRIEPKVQ